MALKLNDGIRKQIADAVAKCFSGTGGIGGTGGTSGTLIVYNSPQPGTGGATSGTCLALVGIGPLYWAAASNGTAALGAVQTGTAGNDGTAAWARLMDAGGNYIIDGACGTAAASDFVIDTDVIATSAVVTLTAATIVQPAS